MGKFEFRFTGDEIDFADGKETVEGWIARLESAVSRLENLDKENGQEEANQKTKD